MQEKKDSVQKAVENKFRAMMEQADSDPKLKKEVMSTITRIENIATLMDLFTIKLIKTESAIIKGMSGNIDEENLDD